VTQSRGQDVGRTSIRVALAATGLVAALYVAVAIAVVVIFTKTQTDQIDARLAASLQHEQHQPDGGGPFEPPPADRPGDQPVLSWIVKSDGRVQADDRNDLSLPSQYASVAGPTTVVINGNEVRLAGASSGSGYKVVGQTLNELAKARSTVIQAEILIAPLLLLVVFVGAVTIGRRVASPIERARQRQLDFAADASHELRTPLSVIEAHTSLALSEPRDPTWYRTAFEQVDRESTRMRRLVEDLLWLARFDATSSSPNAEPVDVGLLAEQAAERFGVIAEARRLELRVQGRDSGAVITAPPEWLDRLLGVLLDNACKYSPDGGAVTVGVALDGARVRLTVDDTGPGIPEAERERVFDRFHRATEGPGGAGLGLAIADAIVRATGGRWQVGASPAGGARMAVTWPASFRGRRESSQAAPQTRPAREG
jgi:signal transduction histidine kinase